MSYLNHLLGWVERPDFCFFTGPEILLAETLILGGDGGVSGGANLYPQLFTSLHRAFTMGDIKNMMAYQQVIKELDRLVYFEGFMKGVKTAMAIKGICKEIAIPPQFSMTAPGRKKLASSLLYLEDKYPFLK
jgi:4-hydroxy-tetrahydrodipicolinate synthase